MTLARTRRTVESQHKLLKTVRNFGSLCVKYSRETDTVKNFENNVLQPTIEDFQYFNSYEVEDIRVVDGKDANGLPVDISTVVYQEVQKTLDDCLCHFLPLVYRLQTVSEGVLRPPRFGRPRL
jgi:hypothetical protein